jgi:hypothetical protein
VSEQKKSCRAGNGKRSLAAGRWWVFFFLSLFPFPLLSLSLSETPRKVQATARDHLQAHTGQARYVGMVLGGIVDVVVGVVVGVCEREVGAMTS